MALGASVVEISVLEEAKFPTFFEQAEKIHIIKIIAI